MPEGLDIALYLNLLFLGVVGLAALFGFMRGTVKSVYYLIIKAVFIGLFFVSIDLVVNQLWTMPLPVMGQLAQFVPELASATTLQEALPLLLQTFLPENMQSTLTNEEFLAFTTGIALFVVKIIYTIFYFTVFSILYKFVTFIIRIIVVRPKKTSMVGRLIGAGVGAANGLLSVFVTLIVLGGLMSINESVLTLADSALGVSMYTENEPLGVVVPVSETTVYLNNQRVQPSYEAFPMNTEPTQDLGELEETVNMLNEVVDAYNANYFVILFSTVSIEDENTNQEAALNLYLFDSVFSFNYDDNQISFRKELDIVSDVARVIIESEYQETNNLSDLTGTEIETLFETLSYSDLFTSLVPLAIEIGADFTDVDLPMERDELYALDWEAEVKQLGVVAAMTFELVNTAGLLEDDPNLETVTLDGQEVRDVFDAFSESDLITKAVGIALDVFITEDSEFSAIITVPEDLVWETEFQAMGEVVGQIVDTGITVGDLQSGDFMVILTGLAALDFEVLYDSKIISYALVNILSGQAGFEGLDMIIVTDDVNWFDTDTETGELRNILTALNQMAEIAAEIGDFEELSLNLVFELDQEALDELLASKVLAATVGALLIDQLGNELTIPHTAKETVIVDSNPREVVTAQEIKNVFKAVALLEVVDLENLQFDLSLLNVLGTEADPTILDQEKADDLFASDILWATLSTLLFDNMNTSDFITIPYQNQDDEAVRFVDTVDDIEYVTKEELTNVLEAVLALDLEDFENFDSLDLSLIQDNISTLLGSAILHATISDQLLDMMTGDTLVVPYVDQDSNAIRITVGNPGEETEYILDTELIAVLDGLEALGITGIDGFDGGFDMASLLAEGALDTLLESAIIHATVSDLLIDQETDGLITVPYIAEDDTEIRFTRGSVGFETEYVLKSELTAMIDALDILGLTDLESFDGTLDLSILATEAEPGVLNASVVLESAIIHATISEKVIELGTDGTINVPFYQEDDITTIRLEKGPSGNETTYIIKSEIEAMIIAMDILNVLDVEAFTGTLDLTVLVDEYEVGVLNATKALESSIIQATISDQLITLDNDGTVVVPTYKDDDTTLIRITVGSGLETTEYILADELVSAIIAMDILGVLDVEAFTGTLDLSVLVNEYEAGVLNATKALESSIIQATISEQVIDLDASGTVVVPTFKEDDVTQIKVSVGDVLDGTNTDYIIVDELVATIIAMDILNVLDIEAFTGTLDLTVLVNEYEPGVLNASKALESSIIQATISEQVLDLDTSGTIIVPTFKADDTTLIRLNVGDNLQGTDTAYILKDELVSTIIALDILGVLDVEAFTGSLDLSVLANEYSVGVTNANKALESSIIQATISDQILALHDSNTVIVPGRASDNTTIIRINVGDNLNGTDTSYIDALELENTIMALDLLDILDVEGYTGAIDLSVFYTESNRNILLASAIMHATISDQLYDLDTANTLTIPYTKDSGSGLEAVRISDSYLSIDTDFVAKDEIHALIEALELFGFTDVNDFSGAFDLSILNNETNQDTLLASASMHATISQTLFDLGSAVLIVPYESQPTSLNPSVDVRFDIGNVGFETEFILNTEIKSLINALLAMGYNNLDSFGSGIELDKFFAQKETILLSHSIHATISNNMLTQTGGALVIPNQDLALNDIRITTSGSIVYVEKDEVLAILNGLETLGFTNFNNINVNPGNLLNQDYASVIDSSISLQATISKPILDIALDDSAAAGVTTLIVPNFFRETINVGVGTETQIEAEELKDLLDGLKVLNITNFGDAIDASTITSLTDTDLDTLLLSGAIHTSVNNILRGNGNISIPDLAKSTYYAISYELSTPTEIKLFIKAVSTLGQTSFATASFNLTAIASLTETERNTIIDSMIVRNTIQPQVDTAVTAYQVSIFPASYNVDPTYYHESDPSLFLTKQGLINVLTEIGLIS
jgi:hypothetical protein